MNTTFFTTLSTQEFQELIESSVRNVVHLKPPRPDDEEDTLLDTKEAAELIKYEVTSVYGLVKRKKIPFCKVEGKLLFSRKKLLAWIGSGQQVVAQ
ncbi:DNA binding domain-containing protein, excisionase family [Mucilaginibacter gossypiicola]|uniref:DNA binding domain-containing protein, excisionase family n=1 Tax=Mucilaginibacter gossypiicola TaxID=551995 RepID=A0A1H8DS57_9SPHI|nr:helix-turn-helix domain-containing protein [Mucilaginibacter gossypiicola]SEN09388.1 DNA binding domain-containing protein, excisionase family [Mucilaginibacter gossypiicola]